MWEKATAVLFFKGRLKFYHVSGEEGGPATAPSVLVAFDMKNAQCLEKSRIDGAFVMLAGLPRPSERRAAQIQPPENKQLAPAGQTSPATRTTLVTPTGIIPASTTSTPNTPVTGGGGGTTLRRATWMALVHAIASRRQKIWRAPKWGSLFGFLKRSMESLRRAARMLARRK